MKRARHYHRWVLYLGLLLTSSGILGCRVSPPPPRWQPDDLPVAAAEAARLRALVLAASDQIISFRGLFGLHIRRGDEHAAFRQAIVFVRPDRLRIEALPPTGAVSLHLLVANRGTVVSLDPTVKEAAVGPSSTAVFRRFLNLPFREGEIMALVAGRVEPGTLDDSSDVRCGQAECTIARANGRHVWRVDRTSGEIRSVRLSDPLQGKARVEVLYTAYADVGGVRIPSALTFRLPNDGVDLELTYRTGSVNTPIPDRLFELTIPSDYTRR